MADDMMSTSTYSVPTAIVWGQLIKSAYSTYEADKDDKNPLTPTNLPSGWQVVANLQSDAVFGFISKVEFVGFVVQATNDPQQIGIVYRGTDCTMDWLEDFEALHTSFTDVPNGGRTEKGFTQMFRSIRVIKPGATEFQTLDQFCQSLSATTHVTVTGHSLGGAIANLTGVWIAAHYPSLALELYTFAAPMTGNDTFASTFNALVTNSYRIYNKPDIVPKSPLHVMGYDQVNTGIEVNSLNDPDLPRSIGGYHSMNTYLTLLEQQVGGTTS